MTDDIKSLLIDAAKAAGIKGMFVGDDFYETRSDYLSYPWNPLTDDGDSARLRTALEIDVEYDKSGAMVKHADDAWAALYTDHSGDKNAALRMATLKLAAEIGRSKEQHSHCACPACRDGTIHASDCSVHNEPAMRNGPCDCGVKEAQRD